jgi:hypothetical protein
MSLSVTNTFIAGTTITASAMNTNFSDVVAYVNGQNVGSANLVSGSVGAAGYSDLSTHIVDASTLTLASNQISVASGGITATQLASNAVTTVKITDSNVTTAKINDSAVTTAKINASAVTTAKIADANVTQAKLATRALNGTVGADPGAGGVSRYAWGSAGLTGSYANFATCNLTTTGRPVMILCTHVQGTNADIGVFSLAAGAQVDIAITRDGDTSSGTTISQSTLYVNSAAKIPIPCISYIDFAPSAAAHTWQISFKITGAPAATVYSGTLVVYEL